MTSTALTPVDIASYVAAGSLALSKLFSAAQPLWNKLPRWLAVAIPVLVVDLPQVAQSFGGVATGTSITTAIITSVAMLLPGLAEAEETPAQTSAAKADATAVAKAMPK